MIINMTSNGINMKNKRIIFSLIGFTLIAILFSEEKQILWDLGVIIQASSQYVESNENPTLSEKTITNNSSIKALISNPFIPPRSIFNEKNDNGRNGCRCTLICVNRGFGFFMDYR